MSCISSPFHVLLPTPVNLLDRGELGTLIPTLPAKTKTKKKQPTNKNICEISYLHDIQKKWNGKAEQSKAFTLVATCCCFSSAVLETTCETLKPAFSLRGTWLQRIPPLPAGMWIRSSENRLPFLNCFLVGGDSFLCRFAPLPWEKNIPLVLQHGLRPSSPSWQDGCHHTASEIWDFVRGGGEAAAVSPSCPQFIRKKPCLRGAILTSSHRCLLCLPSAFQVRIKDGWTHTSEDLHSDCWACCFSYRAQCLGPSKASPAGTLLTAWANYWCKLQLLKSLKVAQMDKTGISFRCNC